MSQRKIFVARHGERLDFIDPNWRAGASLPDDPPLTPRGEQQATQLGQHLRDAGITSVYASPFQRCARTAALAAAHMGEQSIGVNIEPGLCERLGMVRYYMTENGPLWQTVDQLAMEALVVDNICLTNRQYQPVFPYSFNIDGYPESTDDLAARGRKLIQQILARDTTEGNVLLVGHISSVKAIISTLAPQTTMLTLGLPYCCLSKFVPKEGSHTEFVTETLCDNSFQTEEARMATVSEFSSGFARTRHVLMLARGLFHSTLFSKD